MQTQSDSEVYIQQELNHKLEKPPLFTIKRFLTIPLLLSECSTYSKSHDFVSII